MLKKPVDRQEYNQRAYIAMQPMRMRILSSLNESESYASKLADDLSMNPKVVQFHLDILLKYGLVSGAFDLESPTEGRTVAVRRFKLTEDGQDIFNDISHLHRS